MRPHISGAVLRYDGHRRAGTARPTHPCTWEIARFHPTTPLSCLSCLGNGRYQDPPATSRSWIVGVQADGGWTEPPAEPEVGPASWAALPVRGTPAVFALFAAFSQKRARQSNTSIATMITTYQASLLMTLFSFALSTELAQQANQVSGHADGDFDGDEPEDDSKHIEFLSVNGDGGVFSVYPSRGQGI